MRGVYVDVMTISAHRAGSSPHARGLLRRRRDSPSWGGIIPACAGFTARVIATAGFRGDHPRMRGVYGARARGNRRHEGSSPHARGLPDGGHGVGQADRIIPACAGFTPGRSRCCSRWGDHPRMRGVYGLPKFGGGVLGGSSPHARGLPAPGLGGPGLRGIIPACAGFTRRQGSCPPRWPDHPRMRGVYVPRYGDHPRTRGVYHFFSPFWRMTAGSSPHARGLRRILINSYVKRRIIPARAGFTVMMTSGGGMSPDHPRTRGVY